MNFARYASSSEWSKLSHTEKLVVERHMRIWEHIPVYPASISIEDIDQKMTEQGFYCDARDLITALADLVRHGVIEPIFMKDPVKEE